MRTLVIKKIVQSLGFKKDKSFDSYILDGDYSKNIQVVYCRKSFIKNANIVELLIFSSDMYKEVISIGYIGKNMDVRNGVYANHSTSISFSDLSENNLVKKLKKLIIKF